MRSFDVLTSKKIFAFSSGELAIQPKRVLMVVDSKSGSKCTSFIKSSS